NHIDKDIDPITMALNGVCQTAPSPLIDLDDLSVVSGHDLFDTIHNGTCLFFASFGAENECKFVISLHEATSFLWVCTGQCAEAQCLPEQVEHQHHVDAYVQQIPRPYLARLCHYNIDHYP